MDTGGGGCGGCEGGLLGVTLLGHHTERLFMVACVSCMAVSPMEARSQ